MIRLKFLLLTFLFWSVAPIAQAGLIDGDAFPADSVPDHLNLLQGGAYDGLRFFDSGISQGLSLAAALNAAQALESNARLATPEEVDALFAGWSAVLGAVDFTQAYQPGAGVVAYSAFDPDPLAADLAGFIQVMGGPTIAPNVQTWWTDPDNSFDSLTTLDYLDVQSDGTTFEHIQFIQLNVTPPSSTRSFFIVSESTSTAVPEPSTAILLSLSAACCALSFRRRFFLRSGKSRTSRLSPLNCHHL